MRDITRELATYGQYLLDTTPAATVDLGPVRVVVPAGPPARARNRIPAWVVASVAAFVVGATLMAILLLRGPAASEPVPFIEPSRTTLAGVPTVPTAEPPVMVVSVSPGTWTSLAEYTARTSPSAVTCPPSTDPRVPGRRDQSRPPNGQAMGQQAAFDVESGLVVYASPEDGDVWLFDICTNAWAQSGATAPEGVRGLVYDIDSDVVIGFDPFGSEAGSVWVYDANRDSAIVRTAQTRLRGPTSPVFDPPSGLVILEGDGLVAYDVETDTWVDLGAAPSGTELLGYDAATERLVFGSSDADTALVDPRTGEMTQLVGSAAPPLIFGYPPVFSTTAAGSPSAVFHDLGGGALVRFDADTGRWMTVYDELPFSAEPPGVRTYDGIVWDSINRRLIGFGGAERVGFEWEQRDDVWAIDLHSGEVVQLVPASAARSASDA